MRNLASKRPAIKVFLFPGETGLAIRQRVEAFSTRVKFLIFGKIKFHGNSSIPNSVNHFSDGGGVDVVVKKIRPLTIRYGRM